MILENRNRVVHALEKHNVHEKQKELNHARKNIEIENQYLERKPTLSKGFSLLRPDNSYL